MTGQERDYDEVLSRVLHSTADPVEPVGDGLAKIRARLAEPWLKRQWWLLRSELVVVGWVLTVRCQSWLSTVRSGSADGEGDGAAGAAGAGTWLRSLRAALGARRRSQRPALHARLRSQRPALGARLRSLRPALGARLRSLRPGLDAIVAWASGKRPRGSGAPPGRPIGPVMTWLRPALAVAGAVVLVVAGVFALGQIRQTFGLENASQNGTSTPSQAGGPGNPNGTGGLIPGGQSPAKGRAASARRGGTSRDKHPSPAACVSPSTTPINPTPTPTPTTPSPTPTTPSPTPTTPSPTATPSTTSGPMASSVARGHIQTTRTTALIACAPSPSASPTNQSTAVP